MLSLRTRWLILLLFPLALTWPLAAHALDAIPQGSEPSLTVPLFVVVPGNIVPWERTG